MGGAHIERGWDEIRLIRDYEGGKLSRHVLNGATMVRVVISTFGKLCPAQGFLQS